MQDTHYRHLRNNLSALLAAIFGIRSRRFARVVSAKQVKHCGRNRGRVTKGDE